MRREDLAQKLSLTEDGRAGTEDEEQLKKKRRRGRLERPKKEFNAKFTLFELVLYLLLLGVFTGVMVNSRDTTYSFAFAELVRTRLEQPFRVQDTEVYKTMKTVSTLEELTHFLRGPFIDTLFGEQVDYRNGERLRDPKDFGWVNSQNRLLGAPRIRQQMVDVSSCNVLESRVKRWTPNCFAKAGPKEYVRTAQLYGEGLDANGTRRVYDVETDSNVPYFSFYRRYTDGGMVVDVPARKRHAEALIGQLERDQFLNLETRILLIDFALINVNINMMCIVRLSFERLETGGVFFFQARGARMQPRSPALRRSPPRPLPVQSVRTVRLLPYGGEGGNSRHALDSVLVAIVCVYVVQEGWEIFKAARDDLLLACAAPFPQRSLARCRAAASVGRYVKRLWNVYDIVNIIIFWAAFALRNYVHNEILAMEVRAHQHARPLANGLALTLAGETGQELRPLEDEVHYNMQPVSDASMAETYLMAVNAVLVYFKIFKCALALAAALPRGRCASFPRAS